VFVVDPDGVADDAADFDVAGVALGAMAGGMLTIEDIVAEDLDWEVVEGEEEAETEPMETECDGRVEEGLEEAASSGSAEVADAVQPGDAETQVWRDYACKLEDEAQWLRDELAASRAQKYDAELMSCEGADKLRVRVEVDDPGDSRKTKLVSLEEWLREHARKDGRLPILTSTERLRAAQMARGAYQAVYAKEAEKLRVRHAAEIAAAEQRHSAKLAHSLVRARRARKSASAPSRTRPTQTRRPTTVQSSMRSSARASRWRSSGSTMARAPPSPSASCTAT